MKYSLSPSLMISFSSASPSASRAASPPMPPERLSIDSLSTRAANIPRDSALDSLLTSLDRHLGQLGDLLHEIDRADHEPHLGVFILFAAVVGDADEAVDVHRAFVLVGDADVIGAPGDAAGEVGDLDRGFAVDLALHVPIQHLRLVVRKCRIEHFQLVGRRQKFQLDDWMGRSAYSPRRTAAGSTPFLNVTMRVSRTSVMSSLL